MIFLPWLVEIFMVIIKMEAVLQPGHQLRNFFPMFDPNWTMAIQRFVIACRNWPIAITKEDLTRIRRLVVWPVAEHDSLEHRLNRQHRVVDRAVTIFVHVLFIRRRVTRITISHARQAVKLVVTINSKERSTKKIMEKTTMKTTRIIAVNVRIETMITPSWITWKSSFMPRAISSRACGMSWKSYHGGYLFHCWFCSVFTPVSIFLCPDSL